MPDAALLHVAPQATLWAPAPGPPPFTLCLARWSTWPAVPFSPGEGAAGRRASSRGAPCVLAGPVGRWAKRQQRPWRWAPAWSGSRRAAVPAWRARRRDALIAGVYVCLTMHACTAAAWPPRPGLPQAQGTQRHLQVRCCDAAGGSSSPVEAKVSALAAAGTLSSAEWSWDVFVLVGRTLARRGPSLSLLSALARSWCVTCVERAITGSVREVARRRHLLRVLLLAAAQVYDERPGRAAASLGDTCAGCGSALGSRCGATSWHSGWLCGSTLGGCAAAEQRRPRGTTAAALCVSQETCWRLLAAAPKHGT